MRIEGLDNLTPEGSGGFSQVFRATEVRYDRTVAAKVLNFRLDAEADRIRFERECQAMAQLSDHPHIVPLYSTTYTDEGYPVIVMEFFAGGTLWNFARKGANAAELLDVGVKLASALHTAHERGVTHRDVKPQNVLMSRFSEPGLTDFGISVFDRHRSQGRNRGITLAYASPEALEGVSSRQTDVYSLASTLYTVLADRRPYDLPGTKQSTSDLVRRIVSEDPPSLEQFGFSAAIDHTVRRLGMARSTSDRPATAAEFGDALRRLQRSEGFEVTPWLEANAFTDPSYGADPGDESHAVIFTPDRAPQSVELRNEPEPATGTRRIFAAIAGVLALVLLGVVGLLAAGRGGDEPTEPTDVVVPPVVPTDAGEFYSASLVPPSDLTIEATEDGALLTWRDLNAVPVSFEIQAVVGAQLTGEILTTTGESFVVSGAEPGDCFTMRTLAAEGVQVSLDVMPAVCVAE